MYPVRQGLGTVRHLPFPFTGSARGSAPESRRPLLAREHLDAVAAELDGRPRTTPGRETPAERLAKLRRQPVDHSCRNAPWNAPPADGASVWTRAPW